MTASRDLLQESLAAIERLQARLRVAEQARNAPVAIIGTGCRFPGGVEDLDGYWRVLEDGINAVCDIPSGRWDVEAYYDPDPRAPGKMSTRRGGFPSQVDRFDPQFFGIAPREAATMDPQQRLLLETAWEALESAGLAPEKLQGTSTGVFVGITTSDYGQLMRLGSPESSDVYSATGVALNAAAGRLSFVLGLQGPCAAVDTACSSSLVALHLACQSLRTGESDLALAGGVNVILSPDAMVLFSKWGMMAPDGHCKTFDARADGFVRGEGCAVLALKRLADAQAAGDPILAVMRGSDVNQDGRSSGLTVPNGPAQQQVIRAALRASGLEPGDIDYVEAHGTGTSLGDPIEVEALGAVLGPNRAPDRPVLIGSVKTNLGHTEAASGLAGVLKVVASLQHETIPAHLHFDTPNPRIAWDGLPLQVTAKATPWPRGERVRRAGVSSFGFSGTNAHVILEEAPPVPAVAEEGARATIVPMAARDETALRALAERHLDDLHRHPEKRLADRAYTAAAGRSHGPQRVSFVAETSATLAESVSSWLAGTALPGTAGGKVRPGERPRIACLFPGQGAQYHGMGRGLYDSEPVFRAALDRCAELLAPSLPRPLLEVLYGPPGEGKSLDETGFTQPALFAFEYALAQLWRSWGIVPSVVMGHSVGEFVAACVAGVMTLESAIELIATRARLMQALPAGGAMASIFAPLAEVEEAVRALGGAVAVAARNGPEHVVVSGAAAAVDQVIARFEPRGIRCQRLSVSHAFHSPLVDPMLDQLESAAGRVAFSPPRITVISNLTGAPLPVDGAIDARYWRRHAREAVRFHDSVDAALAAGCDVMLEVGPAPVLLSMASNAFPNAGVAWLASLRKGKDDRREMLSALGELYVRGAPVNWEAVTAPDARRIALPTYPFQRERFWISAPGRRTGMRAGHPLVGAGRPLASPPGAVVWESELSLEAHPWLADHCVQGAAIVPATAYIEMALAAGRELLPAGSLEVTEIENRKPVLLDQETVWEVQLTLRPDGDGWTFTVHGRDRRTASLSTPWTLHVSGRVSQGRDEHVSGLEILREARERCSRELRGTDFYEALQQKGNDWGPAFRGLDQVWIGENEAVGRVRVPGGIEELLPGYLMHPAVSDACGHTLVAALPLASEGNSTGAFVGAGVGTVRFHRPMRERTFWVHARVRRGDADNAHVVHGDVKVYDESGALITETADARLWYLDRHAQQALVGAPPQWFHAVDWEPAPPCIAGPRALPTGPWLLVGDAGEVGEALKARHGGTVLVRFGSRCRLDQDGGEIRPDEPADWIQLLQHYGEARGVVAFAGPGDPLASGQAAARTLYLLQASLAAPGRPRVWLVTRDTHAVLAGDQVDGLALATVWGLGRSFAAEQSERWGGLVDLDSVTPPVAAASLLEQLVSMGPQDDKFAIRDGALFVPRLHRTPPAAGDQFTAPSERTCLVTGGLGGIGLAMAGWLVDRGARHLVLMGRRGLPPRDQWAALPSESPEGRRVEAILAMEKAGARVEVATIDVSDRDAVASLLAARVARGEPAAGGVIHAAGVLSFEPLATQGAAELQQLLAAKTLGAWALHEATLGTPLDFFVACSSASSVLPSPLLGGYAAGNSFLDGLAHYRRARGLSGLSVNWGTWGEVGMAVEGGRSANNSLLRGVGTMGTSAGLSALGTLLSTDVVQSLVMPVNWSELAAAYPAFASEALFAPLVGDVADGAPGVRGPAPGDRHEGALDFLRRQAASVLGLAANRIDPLQPLSIYGLDSLMAVELKNRIEREWGVVIPMVQFLQGPSLSQLAEALAVGGPDAVPAAGGDDWEEGSL